MGTRKGQDSSPSYGLDNHLLSAWTDNVAGITCFNNGILTEDVFGDGHRLLIAGDDNQLKAR